MDAMHCRTPCPAPPARLLLLLCLVSLARAPLARADAPFFEFDGPNGFWGSPGVPAEAFDLLKTAQQAPNAVLKCFAFTPGGDWVFLFGGNGYYSSNVNLPACRKLTELQRQNAEFNCVAFAPTGGWTLFWGQNGSWTEGHVPADAFKAIAQVGTAGGKLRSIAYGPHGAWVLMFDKTGLYFGGVPDDLAKVLGDAVKHGLSVKCVDFYGNDWICLTNNGWWTSNNNLAACQLIAKNIQQGYKPKWIALKPLSGRHDFAKWSQMVHAALDGKLAGGYAFEVLDHGKVVAQGAQGWARAPWEAQNPSVKWTLEKPMDIASCSKVVTATALLKLWEQTQGTPQAFTLDDPFWPHIKNVCPTAHADVKHVTLRQLLMHKSGFKPLDSFLAPADLEHLLNQPLAHKPGTVAAYDNNNFFILHFVIEQLAGSAYASYVKEHVLQPMGITRMETRPEAKAWTLAYEKPGDQRPGAMVEFDCTAFAGAGGWYASVSDLGHFLACLRANKVLSPATTDIMLKENLGWDYSDPGWTKGGMVRTGGNQQNGSAIAYYPDGIDAVILVNCVPPTNIEDLLGQAWMEARGE